MAEGTPNPDDAITEVQCVTCGLMLRSCHPSWGDNVILSLHSAVCAGKLPEPPPLERYVPGLPADYVNPIPVKDGRQK
jgi:hypothetical protein